MLQLQLINTKVIITLQSAHICVHCGIMVAAGYHCGYSEVYKTNVGYILYTNNIIYNNLRDCSVVEDSYQNI